MSQNKKQRLVTQHKKDYIFHTIIMCAIVFVLILFVGWYHLPHITAFAQKSDYTLTKSTSQLSVQTSAMQGEGAVLTSDGYQEIRMIADDLGFTPRTFVLKSGIPVRWIIDAKSLNGCNGAVRVSAYDIFQNLVPGEQTLTFMPTQKGTIPWSCGMGMLRGNFIVNDDVDLSDQKAVAQQLAAVPVPTGGSCSMGGCGGCGRKI